MSTMMNWLRKKKADESSNVLPPSTTTTTASINQSTDLQQTVDGMRELIVRDEAR
jgi:hypothetical protein